MKTIFRLFSNYSDNEEGFILVISMLIMVVLTVIGISATRNTTIELQIAGNDKFYVTDFYTSEARAFEASQRLENEDKDNLRNFELNITDISTNANGVVKSDDIANYDPLDEILVKKILTTTELGDIAVENPDGGSFASVDKGVSTGGSLDVTSTSQIHSYDVYGYSSEKNSSSIIRLGYKKRF